MTQQESPPSFLSESSRRRVPEQPSLSLFQPIHSRDHVERLHEETKRMQHKVERSGHLWGTKRGVPELMQEGNYAALPPEIVEYIRSDLPDESTVVDVGCGEGRFLSELADFTWQHEMLEERRPEDEKIYAQLEKEEQERQALVGALMPTEVRKKITTLLGIDANRHPRTDWIEFPGVELLEQSRPGITSDFIRADVYANLTRIVTHRIPEFGGADLVTSTALAYHLVNPWLAVRNMSSLVKSGGMLAVTTLPRLVNNDEDDACDDSQGYWTKPPVHWHENEAHYFGVHNLLPVVDIHGILVAPGEVVANLNSYNRESHKVMYSVAQTKRMGATLYGGRVSIRKLANQELSMGFLFLARVQDPGDRDLERDALIMARDATEVELLKSKGFASLDDAQAVITAPW